MRNGGEQVLVVNGLGEEIAFHAGKGGIGSCPGPVNACVLENENGVVEIAAPDCAPFPWLS